MLLLPTAWWCLPAAFDATAAAAACTCEDVSVRVCAPKDGRGGTGGGIHLLTESPTDPSDERAEMPPPLDRISFANEYSGSVWMAE